MRQIITTVSNFLVVTLLLSLVVLGVPVDTSSLFGSDTATVKEFCSGVAMVCQV